MFYLKMKADYLRYLAEFKTEEDRKAAAEKTLAAYTAAQDKAAAELPSTNPIRLGLALNFSVFYYEVRALAHCFVVFGLPNAPAADMQFASAISKRMWRVQASSCGASWGRLRSRRPRRSSWSSCSGP